MKKYWSIFCGIFLITMRLSAFSQSIYTPQQIREDMRFLKSELEKYHPNLYKYTPKDKFDHIYDSLSQKVNGNFSIREAYFAMLPLVQSVKCGHTYLIPDRRLLSKNSSHNERPNYFPFSIKEVDDKILISRNYSGNSKLERGTEIMDIDGVSMKDVLSQLQKITYYNGDGTNPDAQRYYCIREFRRLYYLWKGEHEEFTLTYQKRGQDKPKTTKVAAQNADFIYEMLEKRYPDADEDTTGVVSYRLLDSTQKVAMIDVRSFMHEGSMLNSKSFEGETRKIFRRLSDNKIENLILDLRGNSGGLLEYSIYLLRYLVNTPFETCRISFRESAIQRMKNDYKKYDAAYGDEIASHMNSEYTVKTSGGFLESKYDEQRRYKPQDDFHFNNNVYVLMNGGTFSAAALLVSKMHDMGIGTFIGMPCGGAYDGCSAGHFSKIILPNTDLEISLPLGRISYDVDAKKYPKEILQPDYAVGIKTEDFLKNEDSVLKFTLNLIKQRVKAR